MRRGIRRVAVGLSGGVDSAVSALLLKKKGFDVVGVFMQNWDINEEIGQCTVEQDYRDAEQISRTIGIPLVRVNFVKEYWNDVFSNLLKDYETGFTPNPDIYCNKFIKFRTFHDYVRNELGADAVATGHYARTSFGPYLERFTPETNVKFLKAKDSFKDQTFFLSQISQDSLKRAMFPMGDYFKKDVINIARENRLDNVVNKKESMGICFIGSRSFQNFISQYIENKPGKFIDLETGNVVGKHNGIHYWTIGQGCKIAGVKKPYFVYRIDAQSNDILVVQGTDHPALYSDLVLTDQVHWINPEWATLTDRIGTFNCDFRFQHTHPLVPCEILKTSDNRLMIRLSKPTRSLAPGQFAVLYVNDECLGSAKILRIGPSLYSLNLENTTSVRDHEEAANPLKPLIRKLNQT